MYRTTCRYATGTLFFTVSTHLLLPHEPQLEDIVQPPALKTLVASVIGDIVAFVLLEEVSSHSAVAVLK